MAKAAGETPPYFLRKNLSIFNKKSLTIDNVRCYSLDKGGSAMKAALAMMNVVGVVLTILAWIIQIGITVAIALLIGWLLKTAESAVRRKTGHLLPWTLCVFAVLCALLAALALNPPVVCPEEYEDALTPEIHEAVQSVSRGLYSDNIPLVPAHAHITEIKEYEKNGALGYSVYFDINYLYFGRVGMSWSSMDGYNMEKQLFGY